MGGRGGSGVAGVALAAVWLIAGATTRAEDPPPAAAPTEPPTPAKIDAAVARGVAWLRSEQKPDGRFGSQPGETALALMALRHSGVPATDRACLRAAKMLSRDLPDGESYSASFAICALLAQDPKAHAPTIRLLVDDLVRAQCENGQWSYLYRARSKPARGDNSNMQCALIALGAARVHGFEVPVATWRLSLDFLLGAQNKDGGCGYSAGQSQDSYGSMTAGLAMSLVLCEAGVRGVVYDDPAARTTPEALRALAWLGENFTVKASPKARESWKYYWLWSMERAGAVAGVDRVGDHDWYAEGAHDILAQQRDDGGWRHSRDLHDTCWALLFLRRATLRVLTPSRPPPVVTPSRQDAK